MTPQMTPMILFEYLAAFGGGLAVICFLVGFVFELLEKMGDSDIT